MKNVDMIQFNIKIPATTKEQLKVAHQKYIDANGINVSLKAFVEHLMLKAILESK